MTPRKKGPLEKRDCRRDSRLTAADVRDNPDERRFELPIDSEHTAFVEYRLAAGVLIFTHAETPTQFEGRGYGSILAKGALDAVRVRGLTIIAHCSFIAAYIARHPEYQDLLH